MKPTSDVITLLWTERDLQSLKSRLLRSKRLLDAFPASLPRPSLLQEVADTGAGEVVALPLNGVVTIGRAGDPPFCFQDDSSLSCWHFRILVGEDGTCYAQDLQSKGHLWINGRRVDHRRLVHGDHIHAGNQDFVFHDGKALNGEGSCDF